MSLDPPEIRGIFFIRLGAGLYGLQALMRTHFPAIVFF